MLAALEMMLLLLLRVQYAAGWSVFTSRSTFKTMSRAVNRLKLRPAHALATIILNSEHAEHLLTSAIRHAPEYASSPGAAKMECVCY